MSCVFLFGLCAFLATYGAAEQSCEPNETEVENYKKCNTDYCPISNDIVETCDSDVVGKGCQCIFNYRRAANGTCIPTRDCPPFDCPGANEEYNPCPPICPTDNCAQATPDGHCPLPGRIGIILECNPKCRCKENYWRKNGVCVPYAECLIDNE